jgi:hypothetical protein
VSPAARAAADRALAARDPETARRHLRLVAAVEDAGAGRSALATAVAATLVARGVAGGDGPPRPPTPGVTPHRLAVRGAALAVARDDRPLARLADVADLPRAAVRRALARA